MTPEIFDVAILLVVLLYVLVGARRGFVLTLASAVGFLIGALVGIAVLPEVLADRIPDERAALRPVLLLVLVLLLGTLGQAVCARIVRGLRRHLQTSPLRFPDALLGGLLTGVLALATLWFAAGLLRVASPQVLGRAVGSSQVLATVDQAMPAPSERLVGRAVAALDRYGFPRVFDGITAEPLHPVEAPSNGSVTAAVDRAADSVVRIDALAIDCRESHAGSGWVVSRGMVVTNAHVVAGADRVGVVAGGQRYDGTVVAFDPDRDLSVLSVPDLEASPLRLGGLVETDDEVAVAGYPLGGPLQVDAGRVRDVIAARGDDIYGSSGVVRQVYSLRTELRPGNSGGPLLTPDGRVAGVVFARSLDHDHTGYALTLEELRPVLDEIDSDLAPVGTGRCVA